MEDELDEEYGDFDVYGDLFQDLDENSLNIEEYTMDSFYGGIIENTITSFIHSTISTIHLHLFFVFFSCGHATLQEALSVRPLVRWSVVRPLVRDDRVGKCENAHFRPCPPVSNDFVTPRHLTLVLYRMVQSGMSPSIAFFEKEIKFSQREHIFRNYNCPTRE